MSADAGEQRWMKPTVGPQRPGTIVATVAAILLAVSLAAALSVDVVKNGFGTKGDEATYVAMALSVAYDHDLSYERRDLDRYVGLYRFGPAGIFLKRGSQPRLRLDGSPPFVHLRGTPDPRSDRLYFGKAFIYPIVAAPFVRLLGLNGFLVLHVLLIFGVCVCGYLFLAARSRPGPALAFTLAFVGASCLPVYLVFLTPEVFNFSLVFFAYFLWLYKRSRPKTASISCAAAGPTSSPPSSSASPRTRSRAMCCSSARSCCGGGGAGATGPGWPSAPCASS